MIGLKRTLSKSILVFAILLGMIATAVAQAPQGINYQAVARTSDGTPLADTTMSVALTIASDAALTSVEYSEVHTVTTNQFGLFTLVIGGGAPTSGTLPTIDWSTGDKFLNVEVGSLDMGTTQLMSVPYALYAENSNSPRLDSALYNADSNALFLFVGNDTIQSNLDILSISLQIDTVTLENDSFLQIIQGSDTFRVDLSVFSNASDGDTSSTNEKLDTLIFDPVTRVLTITENGIDYSDTIILNDTNIQGGFLEASNLVLENQYGDTFHIDISALATQADLFDDSLALGNSIDVVEGLLNVHLAGDGDTDSLNERIEMVEYTAATKTLTVTEDGIPYSAIINYNDTSLDKGFIDNTNLVLEDEFGDTIHIDISSLATQVDLFNDSLALGNSIDVIEGLLNVHISGDGDTDSLNERIEMVEYTAATKTLTVTEDGIPYSAIINYNDTSLDKGFIENTNLVLEDEFGDTIHIDISSLATQVDLFNDSLALGNSIDAVEGLLNVHIAGDGDTDSLNERIQSVGFNAATKVLTVTEDGIPYTATINYNDTTLEKGYIDNTNLVLEDEFGDTIHIDISSLATQVDLFNDSLALGNSIDVVEGLLNVHLAGDGDTDSLNERIQSVGYNAATKVLTVTEDGIPYTATINYNDTTLEKGYIDNTNLVLEDEFGDTIHIDISSLATQVDLFNDSLALGNSIDVVEGLLNVHIAGDGDTDSLNERIQSVGFNAATKVLTVTEDGIPYTATINYNDTTLEKGYIDNTNLVLEDEFGDTIHIDISSLATQVDLFNDSLTLGNRIDSVGNILDVHVLGDDDTDSLNELITAYFESNDTLYIVEGSNVHNVYLGSLSGDNLGNHEANQNIDLGSHFLSSNGGNKGLSVSGSGVSVHKGEFSIVNDSVSAYMEMISYGTGANAGASIDLWNYAGVALSPATISDGDNLFRLSSAEYVSGGLNAQNPFISYAVDGTPTVSGVPTQLSLTTIDASNAVATGIYLRSDGTVGIGEANPTNALSVAGDIDADSVLVNGIEINGNYILPGNAPASGQVMLYDGTDVVWGNVFDDDEWVNSGADAIKATRNVAIGDTTALSFNGGPQNALIVGDNISFDGNNSVAFGDNISLSLANNSSAIGFRISSSAARTHALGSWIDITAQDALVIGGGIDNINRLTNNISGSIMLGYNSTIPTLTITEAAGIGTVGNVGIGTSSPTNTLSVAGDMDADTAYIDSLVVNGAYGLPTNAPTNYGDVISYNGTGLEWQSPSLGDHDWDSTVVNNYLYNIDQPVYIGDTVSPVGIGGRLNVITSDSFGMMSVIDGNTGTIQSMAGLFYNLDQNTTNESFGVGAASQGAGGYRTGVWGIGRNGTENIGVQALAETEAGNTSELNRGLFAAAVQGDTNVAVEGLASDGDKAIGIRMDVAGATTEGIGAVFNVFGNGENYGVIAFTEGGNEARGVIGDATNGITESRGVQGFAGGSPINMGLVGQADGALATDTSYGIYAEANGSGAKYAGYFASGNVYVQDTLVLDLNGGATDGYVLTSDANGYATWQPASSGSLFELNGTVVRDTGDYDSHDFVFGSPQLDDDANSDHDARMFFDKSKGAFRVGKVINTHWNTDSVGDQSFASGLNNKAIATNSSVLGGQANRVNGAYSSIVGGSQNEVTGGRSSIVGGTQNEVNGGFSITAGGQGHLVDVNYSGVFGGRDNALVGDGHLGAIIGGDKDTVSGLSGVILGGQNLYAPSFGEVVLGQFNEEYTPASSLTFVGSDKIFVIGNGTNNSNRSNALTILKNGNAYLNGDLTLSNGTDSLLFADFGTTANNGDVLTFQNDSAVWASSMDDDWDRLGNTIYNSADTVVIGDSVGVGRFNVISEDAIGAAIGLRGTNNSPGQTNALFVVNRDKGNSENSGVFSISNSSTATENYGLQAYSDSADYNYGVVAVAGNQSTTESFGVFATAASATGTSHGVYSTASSNNVGYGVFTNAVTLNDTAYGVYSSASSGFGPAYSGYFDDGDVYIKDTLEVDSILKYSHSSVQQGYYLRTNADGTVYADTLGVPDTCPSGFVSVNNDFCIEEDSNASLTWFQAVLNCNTNEAQLPTLSEWYLGVQVGAITARNNSIWEWIDGSTSNNVQRAGGGGSDESISMDSPANTNAFRCVYHLKN